MQPFGPCRKQENVVLGVAEKDDGPTTTDRQGSIGDKRVYTLGRRDAKKRIPVESHFD